MSDTPKSDCLVKLANDLPTTAMERLALMDGLKELERELAAMTKERDHAMGVIGDCRDLLCDALPYMNQPASVMIRELVKQRDEANARAAAMAAQRDRLAEALDCCAVALRVAGKRHDEDRGTSGFFDVEIDKAEQAIAAVKGGEK